MISIIESTSQIQGGENNRLSFMHGIDYVIVNGHNYSLSVVCLMYFYHVFLSSIYTAFYL